MIATQETCSQPDCEQKVKRRGLCYGHYMKWWRYGDPAYEAPRRRADLLGQRFGDVVVVDELDAGHWECRCDCGRTTRVRGSSLTSGGTTTCGDGPTHHRAMSISYGAAHWRVRRDKGRASDHHCADCESRAAHWSYDHADPDEIISAGGLPYSGDSDHYVPRCVSCHKRFDLDRSASRDYVEVNDGA